MKKEIAITAADMLKEDFSRQEMHAIASTMLDRPYNGGSEPREEAPKGVRIEHYKGRDCIIFPSITEREFALYPHYKELPLVEKENMDRYKAKQQTEVEALHDMDCAARTDELMEAGSPAAKYVRDIGFDIPSLAVDAAIVYYREEIDRLSESIGGDMLPPHLWACCRCYADYAWHANGSHGYFYNNYMYNSLGVVPVSLYRP